METYALCFAIVMLCIGSLKHTFRIRDLERDVVLAEHQIEVLAKLAGVKFYEEIDAEASAK